MSELIFGFINGFCTGVLFTSLIIYYLVRRLKRNETS